MSFQKKVFPLAFALSICSSFASGVLHLKGKLVSITETEYVVETKTKVYHIDKKAVSSDVTKTLDRTEIPVSLDVPFNAVKGVKSKTK